MREDRLGLLCENLSKNIFPLFSGQCRKIITILTKSVWKTGNALSSALSKRIDGGVNLKKMNRTPESTYPWQ
jgi:hypothetical protein